MDVVAVVDGRDIWGIHPWQADKAFGVPDLSGKLAIGECGLDALRGPSLEVQEEVFRGQIALSERLGKPLIIHCVKALDRLLKVQKTPIPSQKWMFHGFRGKPQQLRSLLDAGFSQVVCINPPFKGDLQSPLSLEVAMKPDTAKKNIRATAQLLVKSEK